MGKVECFTIKMYITNVKKKKLLVWIKYSTYAFSVSNTNQFVDANIGLASAGKCKVHSLPYTLLGKS